MNLIIKVLTIASYIFPLFLYQRLIPRQKIIFSRPNIHQDKCLFRKNGGVVLKVRAASIKINGSPQEPNQVNTADVVGRPI